jgi:hypothetical protein
MSLLSRFAKQGRPIEVKDLPRECGHWELAPRWDSAADIGKEDRVTYYTCANCKENFTREQAVELRSA